MTVKERIAAKVLSGKWLLTVTGGFCLVLITAVDGVLALRGKELFVDPGALLAIITGIVMSYFGRPADAVAPPAASADPEALGAFAQRMQERLGQFKP